MAGTIIDKFAYHQPLYRQHVKLQDPGIYVSRAWITKLMPAAVSLIEPIFNAQLDSVRRCRVIAMDETPINAGRAGPGKMKAAYFWPVVGFLPVIEKLSRKHKRQMSASLRMDKTSIRSRTCESNSTAPA